MPAQPTQLTDQADQLAQALAAVLEPLRGQDLVDATIEAILKHRALIDYVDEAHEALVAAESSDPSAVELLSKAYSDAMLNNRAQIAVVAALTDKLGYIPEVRSVHITDVSAKSSHAPQRSG